MIISASLLASAGIVSTPSSRPPPLAPLRRLAALLVSSPARSLGSLGDPSFAAFFAGIGLLLAPPPALAFAAVLGRVGSLFVLLTAGASPRAAVSTAVAAVSAAALVALFLLLLALLIVLARLAAAALSAVPTLILFLG